MILKGTAATLKVTVYVDGTATDPSAVGTVTVADQDGATVASGAGTIAGGNTGQVTFALTAAQAANVAKLTITWAGIQIAGGTAFSLTTEEEIVGELLFTEAEARAFDNSSMPASGGAVNYTDAQLLEPRSRIHDAFETILGYPLGQRCYRDTLDGDGTPALRLERAHVRSIRAISTRASGGTTWTAYTASELADVLVTKWGLIERETLGVFTKGRQNIRVTYEAGKAIHPELRRAALQVLRNQVVVSNVPARALSLSTEMGQYRLAVADSLRDHWFGLPDVDAVLQRHREESAW